MGTWLSPDWENGLFSISNPNLKLEVSLYQFFNGLSEVSSKGVPLVILLVINVLVSEVPGKLINLPVTKGV